MSIKTALIRILPTSDSVLSLRRLTTNCNEVNGSFQPSVYNVIYRNSCYILNIFCFHRNIYQYLTLLSTTTRHTLATLKAIWLNFDYSYPAEQAIVKRPKSVFQKIRR